MIGYMNQLDLIIKAQLDIYNSNYLVVNFPVYEITINGSQVLFSNPNNSINYISHLNKH